MGIVIELTGFEWSFDLEKWSPVTKHTEFGNNAQPVYVRRRDRTKFTMDGEEYEVLAFPAMWNGEMELVFHP